jgi:hypothetical protein
LFCSDDCRSWPREEKINNHGCWGKHTFLTMIIEESVCFMSCEPILLCAIILMWYTRNIFLFFFINWTLRMSDNLPERVQIFGHAHILCITVRENKIICCQIIICDLLLKSAFERIFNIMQLILVIITPYIRMLDSDWLIAVISFTNSGLALWICWIFTSCRCICIRFNFFSWYLQNRICRFYPSPRRLSRNKICKTLNNYCLQWM